MTLFLFARGTAPFLRLPPLRLSILALLDCLVANLFWAPAAHGHAALVAAEPSHGATLAAPPEHVLLRFNEAVSPLVITLLAPDGQSLPVGEVRQQDASLTIALPALQAQGSYALSWRVVSADGHPVGGSLVFALGMSSASNTSSAANPVALEPAGGNRIRMAALWAARLLVYLGFFLGIGSLVAPVFLQYGSAASSALASRPTYPVLFLLTGIVGTLLSLGLFGLDALDAPFAAWSQPATWQVAWASTAGFAAVLALAAFACAGATWTLQRRQPPLAWGAACTALALLGLSLASSGHASMAQPQWLARPAVWLHGLAAVLWIGSLLPLRTTLGAGLPQSVATSKDVPLQRLPLQRFSRGIPWIVAGLAGSGAMLVWLQLDGLASLWGTSYGQVLLVKLGLVLSLLALGAWNRYRLTASAVRGDALSRARLRRVIAWEVGLAVLILATVALWRFTPPPRSLAPAAPPAAVTAQLQGADAQAELTLLPAATGQSGALTLHLLDATAAPLAAQEVDVLFSSAVAGIEPIRYSATRQQAGHWQVSPLDLPPLTQWQVQLDILISDFERLTLTATISLSPSKEP